MNWEKEFDKKFGELYCIPINTHELGEDQFERCDKEVKQFIVSIVHSALLEGRYSNR